MTIATRVQTYLHRQGVQYTRRRHPYSEGSARTASCCGIPLDQMVKAVLVEDEQQQPLLALIPADRQLSLHHLTQLTGRHFHLVDEATVVNQFNDCRPGAVPAFGVAYAVETVIDDSLCHKPTVYLEAGDHEELLELTREQFCSLVQDCQRGYVSVSSQTGARWFAE